MMQTPRGKTTGADHRGVGGTVFESQLIRRVRFTNLD